MVTGFVLTTCLLFSGHIKCVEGYQGEDMTDEEFAAFAHEHNDKLRKTYSFIIENRDVIVRGMVGAGTGRALKTFATVYPTFGGLIVAGSVELAKELFKETTQDKTKEERLEELEKMVQDLQDQMVTLRQEMSVKREEIGRAADAHAEEFNERMRNEEKAERERSTSHGDYSYSSDGKDCGPHRDGYKSYRDSSTREIRETVDKIYRDSMSPRSEHVTMDKD